MNSDIQPTNESPVVKTDWTAGYDVALPKCMLVVMSGPDAGKEFGPLGEQTTIGREPWCQVRLTDLGVSGQHCELTCSRAGLRIRDLGSRNGTHCNDLRVIEVVAGNGIRFTVGNTVLCIRLAEETIKSRSSTMDPTRTLVGTSPSMRRMFKQMEMVGPLELPVLLLGETGTGKTSIAQVIHNMSPRRDGPFLDFNCAELNPDLVESQLFGHARGAFTGAHQQTAGIFEQAHGGSLFLDEIGELPLSLQSKLLKVIEKRRVRRLGGNQEIEVDFRLFAATNRNLEMDVAAGRFREDLFYRIAGLAMRVPPLRDRLPDIGMLATWLTQRTALSLRNRGRECAVTDISPDAIDALRNYAWPGNVRQFENVIKRSVEFAKVTILRRENLIMTPFLDEEGAAQDSPQAPKPHAGASKDYNYRAFKARVEVLEAEYFKEVYEEAGGCIAQAARLAGLSRNYMAKMVKELSLGGRADKGNP